MRSIALIKMRPILNLSLLARQIEFTLKLIKTKNIKDGFIEAEEKY